MNSLNKLFPVLVAALAVSSPALAQKTTVIKQDADRPQTVVEVNKGYVVVNGDTVVRPGETAYRKIVIDRESDAPGFDMRAFGGGGRMGGRTAQKARLGVLTDPKQSQGGAYIREVQPASPAQAAGLKAGDKIVAVDGASIADAEELIETIGAHAPEDTVKIAYERAGKRLNTTAYLEGVADEQGGNSGGGMFGMPPGGLDLSEEFGKLFGGSMGRTSDAETPKLGVSVEERADGVGVQVLDVTKGGLADKTGLREGDVITQLGDTKIDSPEALQRTIRRQQGEELTLRYQRNGKAMSTKLMIPKSLRKMDM